MGDATVLVLELLVSSKIMTKKQQQVRRDDICAVGGPETRNGDVNTQPRISSASAHVPEKSETGRRSGIPAADFSEHVVEADTGDAVLPADMATEKKRGIFSLFRRKKDNKETKPAPVVIFFPLRHLFFCQLYFLP